MVQINFAQKQINAKVVYYGPGMSGKTTNLEVIHQRAPAPNRGDLTSISTDGDRTLFFDYMPLDLGTVAGMRTCFQVYTVPGQVYYNSTRKLVLQGVDGVIFVADSSEKMREQNIESLKNLEENLAEYGKNMSTLPLVIQYNKRDLPDAMSLEKLAEDLNVFGVPSFEAVANTGQGVFPTLKALAAVVLKNLAQETGGSGQRATPTPAAPAHETQAAPAPAAEATSPLPAAPQQVAPAPAQMAPVDNGGPVSVPLSETGIRPRAGAMAQGVPAAPAHQAQPLDIAPAPFAHSPAGASAAGAQPAHAPVATAAPAHRPKATTAPAGAARPQAAAQTRRVPAPQPKSKKNNMVYTGAFIVLATAVGAVLARAILSVL